MEQVLDDMIAALEAPRTDWKATARALAVRLAGNLMMGVGIGLGVAVGLALAG